MQKRKNLVKASFIADALSLGSHWVYDTEKIAENYSGIIKEYTAPMSQFHQERKTGEFTHYGEQAYALLESLSDQQDFALKKFKADWIEYLENNEMYMDHSMKDSLEKIKNSNSLKGADNIELGGIARSLPIFLQEDLKLEEFLAVVNLTHNGEVVDQTAEYIYRVIEDILAGKTYQDSLTTNKDLNDFVKANFEKIDSKEKIVENADERGQACPIEDGLPIVLDVLWNADNLLEALTLNIRAAGDTSARAMVIAAVMGADKGLDSIPQNLKDNYKKSAEVKKYLEKIKA